MTRPHAQDDRGKKAKTVAERQRAFRMEGPSWVARLAGFEPTTPWFVAKYSIQLSYSRTLNLNCWVVTRTASRATR
ncbi:conserved hypothetical protein [Paraburkholderia piptadeniae]|uniref:Uncharacterized protein n=1 Tax=Paraburkholderia piptadeniae TaxID=1701573 RepID=A0A1N7SM87_9BURK|nr:conserved hypothetical protein [Paraburkholderia piptadeniae]